MTSKQLNIILGITVVVLLGVAGYFIWAEYGLQPCAKSLLPVEAVNKKTGEKKIFEYPCATPRGWIITDYHPVIKFQPTPTPTDVFVAPPTTSKDETDNWKTYRNAGLGFELKIPSHVSIDKVFNDQYNRLVIFKSDKENFEVMLKQIKSTSLNQYYYLDFPVSFRSTLGGKEALVFEAPNGYCDGPGCSYPFIAYVTKNNDDFYHLVFYGKTKLTDTEESILSTFKFIYNTQAQNSTWKDTVYSQFKDLVSWKVNESLSDWRLVSLDRSQLNKYAKGKIFELSKSFNDTGEPDYSGQRSLEAAVKKVLTNNGWKLVASPQEGSFYNDYLYVKDNHPLVLQIGSRDAVKGGMYVSIQFQY